MWTDALFACWADSACVVAVSANAWTLAFSVINILLTLLSNFSSFSTFWEHALHTLLEGRHSPLLLCCMHLTLKARWLEHPPMVKYEDADNCAKGRVKYRVKAAYVIINFIMNSLGPTCARTLDLDSWPAPCHTLCALRPSMPRALSGTKPRRLQLRKRVAIAQQQATKNFSLYGYNALSVNSVKWHQILTQKSNSDRCLKQVLVICTRSRKNQDPGVVLQATPLQRWRVWSRNHQVVAEEHNYHSG